MTEYMTVRNWDRWQTYRKDRQQPPWIKVHRALMRDPNWIALSDFQRGQLVAIWMLAADRNGCIPRDPKLIQRLCFMDKPPDLNLLIAHGFLDATVTPERRQGDANVTHQSRVEERREEIEERQSSDAKASPRARAFPENWVPKNLSSSENSEFEKFRDHFRANGKRMKDWEAAWRNWKRRAPEFAARGSPTKTIKQAAWDAVCNKVIAEIDNESNVIDLPNRLQIGGNQNSEDRIGQFHATPCRSGNNVAMLGEHVGGSAPCDVEPDDEPGDWPSSA